MYLHIYVPPPDGPRAEPTPAAEEDHPHLPRRRSGGDPSIVYSIVWYSIV